MAHETLKKFKNQDAAKYGKKLIKAFGSPYGVMPHALFWKQADGMNAIWLMDESIEHDFPAKHRDFVYSSKTIDVPTSLYGLFGYVTGSIMIDGLTNTVTARCGTLWANAVTLQFVEDVVAGRTSQDPEKAKQEYARRIKNGPAPAWYQGKAENVTLLGKNKERTVVGDNGDY